MRCSLTVALLLLASGTVAAQTVSPEHLALQAREILHRRCSACHEGAEARGGLHILDHPLLIHPARQLVIPRAPDASRLLEFIEDGSMPQGTRPKVPEDERQALRSWIQAGAPAFTRSHSESYILARIRDDLRGLKLADRPYVRYLSLHHLLTEAGSRSDLDTQRAALNRLVRVLTQTKQPKPIEPIEFKPIEAIEPTQTIFRIDLRALGWNEPVLTGTRDRKPLQPLRLNRFDLFLLEYPYGVLLEKNDDYAILARDFLEQAQQARPLPYVRADWFVAVAPKLAGREVPSDEALMKARNLYETPLTSATAREELDWSEPTAALQAALAPNVLQDLGILPLAKGEALSRSAWERAFGQVARLLKLGVPVLPLDGLSFSDIQPAPPIALDLSVQEAQTKQQKETFSPGDRIVITVKAEEDVVFAVIWATANGRKYQLNLGSNQAKAGEVVRLAPKGKEFYTIGKDLGKEQIVVYAYPAKLLAEAKDFPSGEVYQGEGVPERVVHPFYPLPDVKPRPPFDPARTVKKTIHFEIK